MTDNYHKITFAPGEIVEPEFTPENELTAITVTDAGLESLRVALSEPNSGGSSGEQPLPSGDSGADRSGPATKQDGDGEVLDSGTIDLGMVIVSYDVRVPAEMRSE